MGGGVNAQVGFGTTSPSNDIDVESSSATATAVDINNTGGGDPKINFQLSGTTTFSMGIDNSNSDKFMIGTSAVETNTRFTIDASGNCGIGNTAPTALLDVDGSAIFNESGAAKNFRVESDNNTAMLYVDGTNDRVGIGTSSPLSKLNLAGSFTTDDEIKNMIGMELTNIGYWDWAIGPTVRSGASYFEIRGGADGLGSLTTLLTITGYGGGLMGIGASNPGYKLTVNGQPGANGYTAFTNYSDSRLKTNISSLDTGALSKILQLRPVSFQYNQKYLQLYPNSDLQKVHKGFIAQEIRTVFPEMVSEMKASPDSVQYLDLDVSHLQVYLVKAMQEQQAIIEAQKKENDAQKAEIDALKQNALKVAELENKMNAMLLLLNNKQELTVKQ